MIDFDKLNKETRDFKNNNVDRFNPSAPNTTKTSFNYFNYLNNQTYKENNGVYSSKYY